MSKKKHRLNSSNKSVKVAGDYILVILVLLLVTFGIIMVFSASYYYSINSTGSAYTFLIKDLAYAASGLVLMLVLATVDYKVYRGLSGSVLIISIILLCLLFTPLGVEINFARRWLDLGVATFMPGEFAKIAAILFTASYLSKNPKVINSFSKGVAPLLALCGIYGILIMLQPNMSTAITVCGIIFGIMFMAGLRWFWVFSAAGVGTLAGAILIFGDPKGYRLRRVTSFMDPFADKLGNGYQVVQSLLALGTGGFWGLGLGKSIQKSLYLPEPQNDFILAIIGEELGYCGLLILMLVYILLIWRGFHIALRAKDEFGCLLASGITIMIALQVVMNVAVATSSMPPTGVTLPFVSYGGNALWLFMGSAGILINISRHQRPLDE